MKHLVFILMAFFLIQPVLANNLIEDTAIVALKEAKHSPTGKIFEHGGMIFQRDGGQWGPLIEYMEPTPGGKIDSVRAIDRDKLLPDDVLLATYHIHLCMASYYHELFSMTDVIMAIFSGIPEFMLDECTGDIHEFNAKTDKIHETGKVAHLFDDNCEKMDKHLPSGRIVGNIGETEVEKIMPDVDCVKK